MSIDKIKLKAAMIKWSALPTWWLVKLMTPSLPVEHPWKYKRFSLESWAKGSTNVTKAMDVCLWIQSITLVLLIWRMM